MTSGQSRVNTDDLLDILQLRKPTIPVSQVIMEEITSSWKFYNDSRNNYLKIKIKLGNSPPKGEQNYKKLKTKR